MREAVSTRMAVLSMEESPETAEECFKLEHGAVFMGHPERRSAFDFILKSNNTRSITSMVNPKITDSKQKLSWLVKQLRNQKIEAFAVELSTDEFIPHGLRAIKVFIPELMPMSYSFTNKFLAHPRLYKYAEYLGIKDFSPEHVNPFPQPFA
jgi:ribosomal protein S12 methylthiotransferase accessory factor